MCWASVHNVFEGARCLSGDYQLHIEGYLQRIGIIRVVFVGACNVSRGCS